MDTIDKISKLSRWRITLAVVCALVPASYNFLYTLTTNNGNFFAFITEFLHLNGLLANIVAYSILFFTSFMIGTLFGVAFGRKPRLLHGLVTGIIVTLIQLVPLIYLFAYLSNP